MISNLLRSTWQNPIKKLWCAHEWMLGLPHTSLDFKLKVILHKHLVIYCISVVYICVSMEDDWASTLVKIFNTFVRLKTQIIRYLLDQSFDHNVKPYGGINLSACLLIAIQVDKLWKLNYWPFIVRVERRVWCRKRCFVRKCLKMKWLRAHLVMFVCFLCYSFYKRKSRSKTRPAVLQKTTMIQGAS